MDSSQTEPISGDDSLAAWASKKQTDDNTATLPIELTNSPGTCLEDLNDDCLLEIFSCNSLTLFDLCSLAETCTRFKQITQRVFPKDFGIVCAQHFGYEFISKNYTTPLITPQTVERILKHFGLHLSELFITRGYQSVVNSVGKYCGDATVKNLEINGIEYLENIVEPLDSIFQLVQKLTLDGCNFIRTVSWCVPNCSSLIELNIFSSTGCVEIMECTFPNLERFTWFSSHMYAEKSGRNCDILHKFIKWHDHLKFISISVCCNELLNVIDSNCKELDELILNDMKEYRPSRGSSTPVRLAKLKILGLDLLQISSRPLQYIPLLEVVKSLEIMRMSCYDFYKTPVQIFDVLSQLENLREFHLTYGTVNLIPWTKLAQLRKVIIYSCRCYPRDITNMIEQLINLEELELKRSDPMSDPLLSEEKFLEICEIVERREHVLTIKCELSSKLKEYCDDNRRVKLINVCDSSDD